ncbi:MAG TPA: sodium/proton-translocating pyrophosphatase, partial [Acidimicrobiales bacterium]|nr:sodium/proton-translocating pyrophosphatase [Acidimicrobiales bacterium]
MPAADAAVPHAEQEREHAGMIHGLVAEGGYQAFHLSGVDWVWLTIALIAGVVGIIVGLILMRGVLAASTGTTKMREIAKAIQEGAEAFLRRQFRTIV